MIDIQESTLTLEEAIEMPEYAHLREVVNYLDNNPFEVAFPKKHEAALKRVVSQDVYNLFNENPTMPLKAVITTILSGLSEDISSKLLLKMTQLVIKQWENLFKHTVQKNSLMQAA